MQTVDKKAALKASLASSPFLTSLATDSDDERPSLAL
jgi:hypothetical protein